jgi:chromosome segregation ATPase
MWGDPSAGSGGVEFPKVKSSSPMRQAVAKERQALAEKKAAAKPAASSQGAPTGSRLAELGAPPELLKYVDKLEKVKEEIEQLITERDEKEQAKKSLTERLAQLNDSLARNYTKREEYDKTIAVTEEAASRLEGGQQAMLQAMSKVKKT